MVEGIGLAGESDVDSDERSEEECYSLVSGFRKCGDGDTIFLNG